MTFSTDTGEEEKTALQSALAEITEIDRKLAVLNGEIDQLAERRQSLEKIAVEEMTLQRLDAVRVSGRSWRIEWFHGFSAPDAIKDSVIQAARRAGMLDAVTSINTSRLKALLAEKAKAAGRDPRLPYSAGTEFEGVVSEYVAPKLRHLTVG